MTPIRIEHIELRHFAMPLVAPFETSFGVETEREGLIVTLRGGGLTGSEVPDIHQLGNPDVSGTDLITIHIYAPPLGVLKTYKLGSSTIEQYTPADPDFL